MKPSAIKTLVIGGSGYIGSYLVPLLIAEGRRVTVLGRSLTPRYKLPQGSEYVIGDFGKIELLRQLLDTHQEVVHLAYASVPSTSFENPLDDLLQNLLPTVQFFSEAAGRDIKVVLVSSGGTVYGEVDKWPINENYPTQPISPYGITKLALENYAHLYATTHGLKFVVVRPSNAYGIGQRPFTGQGFIANAIASVIEGMPIRIFGEHGTIRDYLYVSDLASGISSALVRGHLSEIYNIGSGVGLSNADVIAVLRPLMHEIGYGVQVENLPERTFDVKVNVLDSAKLMAHTGWEPLINFTDGLRYVRNWLGDPKNEQFYLASK